MSNKVSLLLHVLAALIVLLGISAALNQVDKTVKSAVNQQQETNLLKGL